MGQIRARVGSRVEDGLGVVGATHHGSQFGLGQPSADLQAGLLQEVGKTCHTFPEGGRGRSQVAPLEAPRGSRGAAGPGQEMVVRWRAGLQADLVDQFSVLGVGPTPVMAPVVGVPFG